MTDLGIGEWVRTAARRAGRTLERAREEYTSGRVSGSLPRDEDGRARIVCRRYAEQRAVHLEDDRPACFESGNADCESCARDVMDGHVETW